MQAPVTAGCVGGDEIERRGQALHRLVRLDIGAGVQDAHGQAVHFAHFGYWHLHTPLGPA